ncbi:MAG TPA: META domain-containing protein [Patescibacteria group bacterium]|nr:META domain-containing protein [Patescibacteria group bacterium]
MIAPAAVGALAAAFAFASPAPAAASPAPVAASSAPTIDELKRTTFHGLQVAPGTITLVDGRWEGKPAAEGGASRPRVELVTDLRLAADLDGDGREEAVVLLAESSGGSGVLVDLAVAGRDGDVVRNVATVLLGDRVQVRDLRLVGGTLVADVVQPGPGDAACCPGQMVTRFFRLKDDRLDEIPSAAEPARLSLEALSGVEWVLRRWSASETAPPAPEVTLSYKDGRISGRAGCNSYFASVTGRLPGQIAVGPAGATQMACPPEVMAVEKRFLGLLPRINRYAFLAGQLVLSFDQDGTPASMTFAGRK